MALPVPVILTICDGLLDEIGRRRHLFAWLRPPGSAADDWLAVDAYYPANRLVVVCHEQRGVHDRLYEELVPAHGLRLLELIRDDLDGDRPAVESELRLMIASLGPAPPRAREPPLEAERGTRENALARVAASFAQAAAPPIERLRVGPDRAAAAERAARVGAARAPLTTRSRAPAATRRRPPLATPPRAPLATPPRPPLATPPRAPLATPPRAPLATGRRNAVHPRPRTRRRAGAARETETLGVLVGLALAVVLGAELYFGVGRAALDHGHLLLAFGIALDACSRALGTIAAGHAGRPDWAWGCALGGSPAVALFAVFRDEGPVATEPAPLAGLLSVLAIAVIALAAIGSVLRI